jgi:hypothetical protein
MAYCQNLQVGGRTQRAQAPQLHHIYIAGGLLDRYLSALVYSDGLYSGIRVKLGPARLHAICIGVCSNHERRYSDLGDLSTTLGEKNETSARAAGR